MTVRFRVAGVPVGTTFPASQRYDPAIVSYEELLDLFWQIHDPTTLNRQGLDVSTQYWSVIFFHNAEQETAAKEFKEKVQRRFGRRVVTEITPASEFYRAEERASLYCRDKARCRA